VSAACFGQGRLTYRGKESPQVKSDWKKFARQAAPAQGRVTEITDT
jgi:hypothetical protein